MKKQLYSLIFGSVLIISALPVVAQVMEIEDFVAQRFTQGVPYEEAIKYDASNTDRLVTLLQDPAKSEHWANTVILLCIIGYDYAFDDVVKFIESRSIDNASEHAYQAKSSAVMALGYLINRTGNTKALNYLESKLQPGAWVSSKMRKANYQKDLIQRNKDLSKQALLGLALSGHPKANAVLQSLKTQRNSKSAASTANLPSLEALEGALFESDKINTKGLKEYYREIQKH